MKRFFATLAAVVLLTSPAFAGDVIKTGPGSQHHILNIDGGDGGNANVRIKNKNKNTNLNFNKNTNKNYNSNRNYNTNVNVNKNSNRQHQGQYQGQGQGQAQSTKNANNSTLVVGGDDYPASTATAPALTSGPQTCMGSTSIGGQGMSFGVSIGTTWRDSDCVRRLNANALVQLGHKDAALALLAQNDDVADALKAAGVSFATLEKLEKEVEVATTNFGQTNDEADSSYYGIDFEKAGFEIE